MNESLAALLKALQLPGEDVFGPEGDEPMYALPAKAIDSLAGPNGRKGRRWFDATQCQAEHAFTRHCQSQNCVGYQSHGPIVHHLLTRKSSDVSDPFVASMGWTAAQLQAVLGLDQQAGEANRRLQGVAGWLLTEPAFLTEGNVVRELHLRIPRANRPRFPLGRSFTAQPSVSDAESQFRAALVPLLDRWGLMNLASWGLPSPQGPLLPNELPETSLARPAHGIHVYIPMHYPLKDDDEIQRKIEKYQQQAARELGIHPSLAGLAHFETYERMFQVLHLERAIRRRFLKNPSGLVGAIEEAASEAFHLSTDRIKRLRKYIAHCQAGMRSQIKELRVSH